MIKKPKLRFPEFSGDWECFKLKDVVDFHKGKGISKADLSVEGNPCILYGELYTTYNEVIDKVYSKTHLSKNLFMSKHNDVIIPSSGETAEDISRASVVLMDDIALGGDLNILRPKNVVDGTFLSYTLNSAKKWDIAKVAQGVSIVHLYASELKNLDINLPTIPEQQKITDFIYAIDSQIETKEQEVENLEEMKKGFMQKIFSQEIRFKDEDGCEYLQWEEKKLGEILDTIPSKSFQVQTSEYLPEGIYEVVDQGQKNVIGYNNDNTKLFKQVPVIVYGDHTTIVKYRDNPFILGGDGTKLLISKKNCLLYIYYAINQYNVKPEGYKRHFNILRNNIIPIPSLPEQLKIANFLSLFDEKIKIEKEILETLKDIKKGLLQQMFV